MPPPRVCTVGGGATTVLYTLCVMNATDRGPILDVEARARQLLVRRKLEAYLGDRVTALRAGLKEGCLVGTWLIFQDGRPSLFDGIWLWIVM